MTKFFVDKLLGPLIIAVIIFAAGAIARVADPKMFIHLIGGIADGDSVHIQTSSDPGHVMSIDARSTSGPVVVLSQDGEIATQKWFVQVTKKITWQSCGPSSNA